MIPWYCFSLVHTKLMRLASANRIDVVKLKSWSEFDHRLTTIGIPTIWLNLGDQFSLYFDLFLIKSIKNWFFWSIFDLLIDLNRYYVNYLIENSRFISKIDRILVKFEPNLPIFGFFRFKFDQFSTNSTNFWSNSKLDSNSDWDFESDCRDE